MEPTLEKIGDYNELKGSKKRIVWLVILSGIMIGMIGQYYYVTSSVSDDLKPEHKSSKIPPKQ